MPVLNHGYDMGLSEADVAWYLARRGWVDLCADFLSQPLFPKPPTPSKPPSRMSRACLAQLQRCRRGPGAHSWRPSQPSGQENSDFLIQSTLLVRILQQMGCVRVVCKLELVRILYQMDLVRVSYQIKDSLPDGFGKDSVPK